MANPFTTNKKMTKKSKDETEASAPESDAKPKKKATRRKKKAKKDPVPKEVAIRHVMQANTSKNTKPELVVRHMLRQLGWPGYRLHWKTSAGRPDIVYPGRKIAIFVNGCFWHRHEGCKKASTPKSNQEFWNAKFERNKARDKRVAEQLESEGWSVVTIWECELEKEKLQHTGEYLYEIMSLADADKANAGKADSAKADGDKADSDKIHSRTEEPPQRGGNQS